MVSSSHIIIKYRRLDLFSKRGHNQLNIERSKIFERFSKAVNSVFSRVYSCTCKSVHCTSMYCIMYTFIILFL